MQLDRHHSKLSIISTCHGPEIFGAKPPSSSCKLAYFNVEFDFPLDVVLI